LIEEVLPTVASEAWILGIFVSQFYGKVTRREGNELDIGMDAIIRLKKLKKIAMKLAFLLFQKEYMFCMKYVFRVRIIR
jgi:hypothetical protein